MTIGVLSVSRETKRHDNGSCNSLARSAGPGCGEASRHHTREEPGCPCVAKLLQEPDNAGGEIKLNKRKARDGTMFHVKQSRLSD